MDVIALIKRDHDEVADLFDHLVVIAANGRHCDEAARIACRLVAAVRIHCRAEERVLYEALRTASSALKAFALAGPALAISTRRSTSYSFAAPATTSIG